ncbi:Elongation factor 1-beta [Trichinella spiralis]|uniref:Elongation factor 1-beta n=1 Tax=Trichinella spiralis TaxID=6334 RepID=A0A0V1C1F8_TRISP|nr:Elongation factor 1-beta [Trichinella spiralis]
MDAKCLFEVYKHIWIDRNKCEAKQIAKICRKKVQLKKLQANSSVNEMVNDIREWRKKMSNHIEAVKVGDKNKSIEFEELLSRLSQMEIAHAKLLERVEKLELRLETVKTGDSKSNAQSSAVEKVDEDENIDLFGSSDEEEDEEKQRIRQEVLKAYEARKSKKPAAVAKSCVVLDVKPWSDETDMNELEKCVRSIKMDGLLWGESKLVPVGYGIKKLQIACVVHDEKVSVDLLSTDIQNFDELVSSA